MSSVAGSTAQVPGVPLRPLGVAELLDAAARLVRRNARASFAITLPVEAPRTLVVALLAYAAADQFSDDTSTPIPGSLSDGGVGLPFSAVLLQVLVGSLALTLLSGLLAPLYVGDALGRPLTTGQTLRRLGRSWWPLVVVTVVVALGLELGLVLLVVGGVWLWGVWAVAAPVVVSEQRGPIRALGRSFDLVRGRFWRVWGIRALGWLVVTVLSVLVTLPAAALATWLGSADPFGDDATIVRPALYVTITALGTLVTGVVLSPFRAAVDTLLYLDLRMRREGLDIALALDAADAAAMPRPAPAPPAW